MSNLPPPPPPALSGSTRKINWRQKRQADDRKEQRLREETERANRAHWHRTGTTPRSRKWSTIDELDDVKFRIVCLLESGLDPMQILVSFDFDGTLGARRTVESQGLSKTNPKSVRDTHREEAKSTDLLTHLNRLGIPYFVNTAANDPQHAYDTMVSIGMPFSDKICTKGTKTIQHKDYFGYKINQCGSVFSAAYDKHVPIDFVIQTCKLDTKVVIHVDDGIVNIRTVIESNLQRDLIGMYFPTVEGTVIGSEPDKTSSFQYLYSDTTAATSLEARRCQEAQDRVHASGSREHPFASKAAADRYQKKHGVRFKKGEQVSVYFKGVLYDTWQW